MPRVPKDGSIELTRDDFHGLLVRVEQAIDDALDERVHANRVERALIDVRLASLVQLRRTIKRRTK